MKWNPKSIDPKKFLRHELARFASHPTSYDGQSAAREICHKLDTRAPLSSENKDFIKEWISGFLVFWDAQPESEFADLPAYARHNMDLMYQTYKQIYKDMSV